MHVRAYLALLSSLALRSRRNFRCKTQIYQGNYVSWQQPLQNWQPDSLLKLRKHANLQPKMPQTAMHQFTRQHCPSALKQTPTLCQSTITLPVIRRRCIYHVSQAYENWIKVQRRSKGGTEHAANSPACQSAVTAYFLRLATSSSLPCPSNSSCVACATLVLRRCGGWQLALQPCEVVECKLVVAVHLKGVG